MNVVECPELRALLLYLGTKLSDKDIPHRTKLASMIVERYRQEHEKLIADLKVCVLSSLVHAIFVTDELYQTAKGRISWTADVWTDSNQRPFLALTAHYMVMDGRRLVMRSRLVMFRHCPETHSGDNMGTYVFAFWKECEILHKVSSV